MLKTVFIQNFRAQFGMMNLILLLRYGKNAAQSKIMKGGKASESNNVSLDEILELQRDVSLSNNQLHNVCRFMKHKGLHTPNTQNTKLNVNDLFESSIVKLEGSNGDESPTEVIYCSIIDQLLKRVEENSWKTSSVKSLWYRSRSGLVESYFLYTRSSI